MKFYSPAKINLFLRILEKRADGYHELASLFQAVSLFDILHFEQSQEDRFTCTTLPTDSSNLVIRARDLFRKKTNLNSSLHIHLEKQIPLEAGLGGGSSNAATTLFALNQLADYPLTEEDLIQLGAELGSDVSFFFSQGTAFCQGRGEIVKNLPHISAEYTLVKPSFGSATPDVYRAFQLKAASTIPPADLLCQFQEGKTAFVNDLETPAFTLNPKLQAFKTDLIHNGFEKVLMSGSGSAFICKGAMNSLMQDCFIQKVQTIARTEGNWYASASIL